MINRTVSGTSVSSILMSVRNWPAASKDFPVFDQMPVHLFDEEWIALAFLENEAHQIFRSLALA
jgi:hypothetical protein